MLAMGHPETHLRCLKVAPPLAEQFSVSVPDRAATETLANHKTEKRRENYSIRAMAQEQVDVTRHYGYERFLATAPDRGARAAHRLLCLDHPQSVENACLTNIVRGSNLTSPREVYPTRSFRMVLRLRL